MWLKPRDCDRQDQIALKLVAVQEHDRAAAGSPLP
jgi:hypothetical protein